MNEWIKNVREFHEGCGTFIPDVPIIPPLHKQKLRQRLVLEEFSEFMVASEDQDIIAIAKELADLLYVTIGTALDYGIDMDKVFAEVHRSNMTKFVEGKAIRREDGKILKPEAYEPADVRGVLGV